MNVLSTATAPRTEWANGPQPQERNHDPSSIMSRKVHRVGLEVPEVGLGKNVERLKLFRRSGTLRIWMSWGVDPPEAHQQWPAKLSMQNVRQDQLGCYIVKLLVSASGFLIWDPDVDLIGRLYLPYGIGGGL